MEDVSTDLRISFRKLITDLNSLILNYLKDLRNVYEIISGDHSFIMFAKFFEKLTFLTPWYVHVRLRIRG